jgi:hypothetical protein
MNLLFSTGLYSLVTGNAAIAALISTRLYPEGALPQDPTLPFVTFQQVGGSHGQRETGPDGLAETRVQFTVVAAAHASRCGIMAALRALLHCYHGALTGGVDVRYAQAETEIEQYQQPSDDSAAAEFVGVQDFTFRHTE